MIWEVAGEVIKSIAPVFTAGAACFGVYIGFRGLEKWRQETVGKQRLDLAQDVLADFYEAADIIEWVRAPHAFHAEMDARPGRDSDPERLRKYRDTYFVPIKRLVDKSEFFAKLNARRYRVIATFGVDSARHYDELNAIQRKITTAAHMLMRLDPDRADQASIDRQHQYEAHIWDVGDDADELCQRMKALIDNVEKTFRPEITKRIS